MLVQGSAEGPSPEAKDIRSGDWMKELAGEWEAGLQVLNHS